MIWKIKTDLTLKNTLYHALSVQDAAESKNDDLVTCSDDDSVKVWGNEANFERSTNLTGHLDYVYALDTLSDGYLASASKDVSVRIWDAENLKLVHTLYSHKGPVISIVAIKPILYKDNRFIHFASGSCDSTIKISRQFLICLLIFPLILLYLILLYLILLYRGISVGNQ